MTYLDYLTYREEDARESLRRRNISFVDSLRRIADRIESTQERLDAAGEGGVADALEDGFSWIENEARTVRSAKERYLEAKQAVQTARELGYQLQIARLSYDALVGFAPTEQ